MGLLLSFVPLMALVSVYAGSISVPSQVCAEPEPTYDIEVVAALPSGRGQVILSSPYSLRIASDEVESALPYYGRAYNVPYGGGRGLFFSGKPEEYSDEETKPGQRKVSFKVRTEEDLFRFTVTIDFTEDKSGNREGTVFITVSSGQRQTISYRGHLVR